jgi:Sulfotransferase family
VSAPTTARGGGAPAPRDTERPAGGGGRIPDFFVVGQPKSGTTALYDMLRAHPQVFMPDSKEPWFFAEELHERTPPRPGGTPRTLAEYSALFAAARPGQRVGEISPLYLWSKTAAERIHQVRPDALIVAILREPASLLRSLHLEFVQRHIEVEGDLRRALELEPERRAGRAIPRHTYWPRTLLYSQHVAYVEQLRRYRERFGADRTLVLIYDDFRADNEATVRQVLRFVGADDAAPIASVEANPTVQVRSQRLHELVHAVSVGRGPASRAMKGAVKVLTPRRLRREALRATQQSLLFGEPRAADDQLMRELRRRYAGEVRALGEYLGRDLVTLWGYDRLD